MSAALDELAELSTEFGHPPVRRTVPSDHRCYVHDTTLEAHQLEAFSGWHEVLVCASHDGTCQYDPDADPAQIEQPADVTAAKAAADRPTVKVTVAV